MQDQKTMMWLIACVCCLVFGYMASFTANFNLDNHGDGGVGSTINTKSQWMGQVARSPYPLMRHGADDNTTELVNMTATDDGDGLRGVILCLHDNIVSMGVSLIRELRCLGNNEIIQVYHCMPNELSDESRALLTRNDPKIEIVDVCTDILGKTGKDNWFGNNKDYAKSFQSYWIKPLALVHTRLTEVILLDGDAILLRNPADLRSIHGYSRTGTTFFYDRVAPVKKFLNKDAGNGKKLLRHIVDTFDYKKFGLDGPKPSEQLLNSWAYKEKTGHEMDSSMVLVNKSRAGKAMDVLKELIFNTQFEYRFSWGDKEAFWLAYELAHQPYFFSPWGLSLVDSVPNKDLQDHPNTMCGSMAHFMPVDDPDTLQELLYVNGKALIEPFPLGVDKTLKSGKSRMYNINPTHVTPRYRRSDFDTSKKRSFECMDDLGSAPIPDYFYKLLLRRRLHYLAVETRVYDALDTCDLH